MTRRGATLMLGAVLLVVFAIAVASMPVPYVVLGPGPTVNTVGTLDGKPVINITGRPRSVSAGHLNLMTVSVGDRIDLLTGVRAWFNRDYAVVPREEIYPPDRTVKQVDAQNSADFRSSEDSAEVAALHQLGIPQQVFVTKVAPGAAATGKLAAGDVLLAVDGVAAASVTELTGLIRKHHPGDQVAVRYVRAGHPATATIRAGAVPGDLTRAMLGIQVDQRPAPPLHISFDINDIGGPSGGLMFALAIVDLLTPADLTGGMFIAGTGTIDGTGTVGPIGGIHQKLVAAKRAGAVVFLTPAANCAEASQLIPHGLRLVKVTTLRDALAALATLRAGAGSLPSCRS
ncbi:MAG: PDZ domain-containing protein [Actinomycetota bacterium]|nr:PDZ domain-containing protein [Actinomycetota bacterium]